MEKNKQRMMVSFLQHFVESDDCRIGILLGIRRTGKTVILEQLKEIFQNAALINFEELNAWEQYAKFLETDSDLLLIDEATHIKEYENAVRIIEHDVHSGKYKRFKVILTGSSYTHIKALHGSVLGGGRSKLFRLPVLSFVEYLNFVGKIPLNNYDCNEIFLHYRHNPQDFFDYLDLKGLDELGGSGLRFTLDEQYLITMYRDMEVSNDNCILSTSNLKITEEEVKAIGGMIAYTISEYVRYETFVKLKGEREVRYAAKVGTFEPNILDNAKINISVREFRNILPPERRAAVLQFLLRCNLAYVEFQYELRNQYSLQQLLADIDAAANKRDFMDIIDNYNICLINPVLYTRLGKDLLQEYKIDTNILYDSFIRGLLLENYLKGSYCTTLGSSYYTIYKLGGDRMMNDLLGEVDMFDDEKGLLVEIAAHDKSSPNLPKYFKDDDLIRILSTNKDDFSLSENSDYHRIPFTKLCILIDTGAVLSLPSNVINNTPRCRP